MRGLSWIVPALLFGTTGAAAQQAQPAAQPEPSATEQRLDPIIVTGRATQDRKQAEALTRAITPRTASDDPLPRFQDSVCFLTSGLDRATLEAIADRIAADAEQAGLRLAGDGCHPNVLVVFVAGIDAELKRLERGHATVFGDRTPSEIRDIAHQPGPVRAWSNTEVRSRDGDPIARDGRLRVSISSRLVATIRKDMLASVVLVERSAVVGKTTRQIADYVAMRALASLRPQGVTGTNTILSLFASAGTAPAEMTAFDRGYLRGLYSGGANQFASVQQGLIVRTILKAEKAAATAPGN